MIKELNDRLDKTGLFVRGGFYPSVADEVPRLPNGKKAETVILIGNAGVELWRSFQEQAVLSRKQPLDSWLRSVILNVTLPMALPGVITAGIFCFILAWNEFLFALIITTNKAVTLPVGLSLFHAEEGVLWHLISAAGIMIMLPMFVLATLIQKHFVQGMTMGAVR